MRWHVDPLGEFYNCNEATVVYFDSASGDTHLLSESAAWLLSILAEQPMDVDELIARATADVDPLDHATLKESVPEILDELFKLDAIYRL